MRISLNHRGRSRLAINFLAVVYLALLFGAHAAHSAATGYDDLDDAAITVKNPAAAPLVAITRTGQRLIAAGLHGVIVYSDDSGQTWHQAKVPTDVTLTSIAFDSDQHGYAVGHFGVILTTADAGLTWTRTLDGLDVINALNDTSRRAQLADPASPDSQLKLRVATAFQNSGPSKPFLAVARCGAGILAAGQQDIAMFSADGGKTWDEWTSAINNPTFRNIYDILDDGAATLLVGEDGLLLKSLNNCRNFTPITGPYGATLFGGILKPAGILLLYGIDGGVYASKDAGASWRQVSLGIDSVISAGLTIDAGKILLGSLDGNLYLADENASVFHQIATPVPFQIAGLASAPDGNLVAVGNGGVDVVQKSDLR